MSIKKEPLTLTTYPIVKQANGTLERSAGKSDFDHLMKNLGQESFNALLDTIKTLSNQYLMFGKRSRIG